MLLGSDTCACIRHFELAGMVLGLATFNGVLLDLKLPVRAHPNTRGLFACVQPRAILSGLLSFAVVLRRRRLACLLAGGVL